VTWLIVELVQGLLVRYVLDAPPFPREDFLSDLTTVLAELSRSDR
jgi:hypothetical protein